VTLTTILATILIFNKLFYLKLQNFCTVPIPLNCSCVYDSTGISTPTKGGQATTNEMCQVYLYYYPATANPGTLVGSYPADLSPPYDMRKDGVYPTFIEFGLLQQGNYSSAGTYHLDTPPIIVPTCKTTHSSKYTIGTAGTTFMPITEFNPLNYPNSMILDELGKYKLYWKVSLNSSDPTNGVISFAAEVETDGWLGLGISPSGNMIGSDVVIGWVDIDTKTVSLLDRKAIAHVQPQIDQSQDIFDVVGYKGQYPKAIPQQSSLYYYPPNEEEQ